ncbi:hypothetical protein KM043_002953 [Ampulex compressa]|nr:hypothetical protein KM043_002953 [Ampulex compressa]
MSAGLNQALPQPSPPPSLLDDTGALPQPSHPTHPSQPRDECLGPREKVAGPSGILFRGVHSIRRDSVARRRALFLSTARRGEYQLWSSSANNADAGTRR